MTKNNREKLNEIVEHLKAKFNPQGIILHGSRASGYAREHSDWDFIILIDYDFRQKQYRDRVGGEEIEFVCYTLPIDEKDIFPLFNVKLKHAKAVHDKNGDAQRIIDLAQKIYEKGVPEEEVTGERLASQKHYLMSTINGMKDSIDNPAMFMKKLGAFYPRIINTWYKVKKRMYPDNIYISIPFIEKEDPAFARELEVVYSLDTSAKQKVIAAEKCMTIIFGEE